MNDEERALLLSSIPDEKTRDTVWAIILSEYPWVLKHRPLHPIIIDEHDVLRWEADPLMINLATPIIRKIGNKRKMELKPPLNVTDVSYVLNPSQQRELDRRLGYSLCAYYEKYSNEI